MLFLVLIVYKDVLLVDSSYSSQQTYKLPRRRLVGTFVGTLIWLIN